MKHSPHLLLIGCGKMGTSLMRGWAHVNTGTIDIVDPNPLPHDLHSTITHYAVDLESLPSAISPYDAIVLAVKPNQINDVCANISARPDLYGPHTIILSIAAGRTVSSIQSILPPTATIIRAMPNLPASVLRGITALYTHSHTSTSARDMGQRLCSAVGDVIWVDDETLMDAVTALSGSGPAYLFLLIEEMARAGVQLGLPPDTAMILARQTVIGASELAHQSPDISAELLRNNVTSPGGTTEAALKILMNDQNGMTDLFTRALTAARDRSRELQQ